MPATRPTRSLCDSIRATLRGQDAYACQRTLSGRLFAAIVTLALLVPTLSQAARQGITINSASDGEIVLTLSPEYSIVTDSAGHSRLTFPGGSYAGPDAAADVFVLPVLLPSNRPASVVIVEEEVQPQSFARLSGEIGSRVQIGPVEIFRTAYSQQISISPVHAYSGGTASVARKLVIKITFPDAVSARTGSEGAVTRRNISNAEREFFQSVFLNGSEEALYRSAVDALTLPRNSPHDARKGSGALADAQWLSVETNAEGVYRITAEDLANAGIKGAVAPNEVELLGVGGTMLDERITATSGEWRKCAIDVRSKSGSVKEIRFYAPGIVSWGYSFRSNLVSSMYHKLNPYSSRGFYLLKIGGEPIGEPRFIATAQDSLKASPVEQSSVLSAVVRENDRTFEYGVFSREMKGEPVPRQSASLSVELELPGYLPDSTIVRVGLNLRSKEDFEVPVSVNGQVVNTLKWSATKDVVERRLWDNAALIPASLGVPTRFDLSVKSTTFETNVWLNWIEVFYRRKLEVGDRSIPFFIAATDQAHRYAFGNAAGGGLWDVTRDDSAVAFGTGSGATLSAELQGTRAKMRKFIAFSERSLISPRLSALASPVLRATLGQQGVNNIIIAPQAFAAEANELKRVREQGGQATEPLTTAVVFVEDIYREFGYGARDLTAIRDFLAYTMRHTSANGTTVPMYVTLLGNGHPDYQNRVTDLPIRVPIYETGGSEFPDRNYIHEAYPDDQFFVRLSPKDAISQAPPDMAIGRIAAHTADEVRSVVNKIRHYENGSDQGVWRGTGSFVADDHAEKGGQFDVLNHFRDTELAIRQLQPRITVNKLYGVNYPTVFTATGRHKPDMEKAIVSAFNNGSVVLSFVGHGNPNVWTHEGVLSVPSTINRFTNFNRLSFVTTATCDFAEYDIYDKVSGGVQLLLKPDGGAVGLLGTSRSVTGNEPLVIEFFRTLFDVPCDVSRGTMSVGVALMAGKAVGLPQFLHYFYILGDPAQRLLVPRQYVVIDSINGQPVGESPTLLRALSHVTVTGRISSTCPESYDYDPTFDGVATVTLRDADSKLTRTSTFDTEVIDQFSVEGPILYRGTSSITNGRFRSSFIVPRDIKFDTNAGRLSIFAAGVDNRSALGLYSSLKLAGADSAAAASAASDTSGPSLAIFLGNRLFRSGDVVSTTSTLIVDVEDPHGLNTSTASVGHSFVAWVDDSTEMIQPLAEGYVAEQDSYQKGTASTRVKLPPGRHSLTVRAFDALNNPSFATVEFVAREEQPFKLFNISAMPNPLRERTIISVMQPASSDQPVDVSIDIFSVDGRHTRTLTAEGRTSDVIEIEWDGMDGDGRSVANGVYVLRVTASNRISGMSSSGLGRVIVTH